MIAASGSLDTMLPTTRLRMSLSTKFRRLGASDAISGGSEPTTSRVITVSSKPSHRPSTNSAGITAQSAAYSP